MTEEALTGFELARARVLSQNREVASNYGGRDDELAI